MTLTRLIRGNKLINFLYQNQIGSFKNASYVTILIVLAVSIVSGYLFTKYLKNQKELRNPYLQTVNIFLRSNNDKGSPISSDAVKSFLNENNYFSGNYHISTYFRRATSERFYHLSDSTSKTTFRTLDEGDPLFQHIWSADNNAIGDSTSYFENSDYGVIVTKSYLKKVGYIEGVWPNHIFIKTRSAKELPLIPIPIYGIVDVLPSHADMVFTKRFFGFLMKFFIPNPGNLFHLELNNQVTFFSLDNTSENLIEEVLNDLGFRKSDYNIHEKRMAFGFRKGYCSKISFYKSGDIDMVVRKIISTDSTLIRLFDKTEPFNNSYRSFNTRLLLNDYYEDYLSIDVQNQEYDQLDYSKLEDSLFNKFLIELDYSSIVRLKFLKETSNLIVLLFSIFLFFGLTYLTTYCLMVQARVFHEFKGIIGNLKASGLRDIELIEVQIRTLLTMFLPSIAIGFCATIIVLQIFKPDIDAIFVSLSYKRFYFQFFIAAVCILMLVGSLLIYNFRKLLKKEPGKLIYN